MGALEQYAQELFSEEEVNALSKIDRKPYSWKVLSVLYGQEKSLAYRQIREKLKAAFKFSGDTNLLLALSHLENVGALVSHWEFPDLGNAAAKVAKGEVVNSIAAERFYKINPEYKAIDIGKALHLMNKN